MPGNLKDRLEFSYESIGTASYLVIKAGPWEELLNYQVSMTGCNTIDRLAQYNVKNSNGDAYCYYNITSKLSLSFFLKRRKLLRNEFIALLADMARTIVDSAGYLLSDACFLLDPDYIFINPENMEIAMVYVPVNAEGDTCKAFKDFILKLVLQLADIDEKAGDNFLQRILACVKNDTFSFSDFLKLLDSLLYGNEADETGSGDCAEEPVAAALEHKNTEVVKKPENRFVRPFGVALLSQLLIAAVVLAVMKYIKLPGGNSFANCLALILIVAAVDIIILKNVLKGVRFNMHDRAEKESGDVKMEGVYPSPGELKMPEGKTGVRSELSITSNTVLLGGIQTGFPILRNKNSPGLEDIIIDKPDYIIGRLKDQVDFVSKSTAVGKIHAQLIRRDDSWFLKDLNSVNGTFVNDGRISGNVEHPLKDGDHIAFANSEYVFVLQC